VPSGIRFTIHEAVTEKYILAASGALEKVVRYYAV
jgi:hypothetical protein